MFRICLILIKKAKVNTNIMKKKIIYLSYDGILDSIGKSQILSYLLLLSKKNKVILVTFEKKEKIDTRKINILQKKLKKQNIIWHYNIFTKKKNIILFLNIILLQFKIIFFIIKYDVKIIHLRSTILGFLVLLPIFLLNTKLIYDIRGFWVDERVDRQGWSKNSFWFLFFRILEKKLYNKSSAIVTLTNESVNILSRKYKLSKLIFYLIRTCVDIKKFTPPKNLVKKNFNLCYLGTVDTAYDFYKVFDLYKIILNHIPHCKFFIFNEDKKKLIHDIFLKNKIKKRNYLIKSCTASMIPSYLKKMNIGLFFLNKNFSIKASMPTKVGEFLSCGVPIICNNFNKDILKLFKNNNIGIVHHFKKMKKKEEFNFIKKIIKLTKQKYRNNCREAAVRHFDIYLAVKSYQKIYDRIYDKI